jgi:hypothetical protein
VTVNVKAAVPPLPSAFETLSIAKVGASSSFWMAPTPRPSAIVAPEAFDKLT